MNIKNVIAKRLKKLEKKYFELGNIPSQKNKVNLLNDSINHLEEDISNLADIEIDDDTLKNIFKEENKEEYKTLLNKLIIVCKAIKMNDFVISLTDTQKSFIEYFLNELKSYRDKLKRKLKNDSIFNIEDMENEIIKLESINQKFEDNEILDKDDFSYLFNLIEDMDFNDKLNLLISIKNYNDNIEKNKKVDLNTLKNLYSKYDKREEVIDELTKNSDEVLKYIDLEKSISILEYLTQRRIINKFPPRVLIIISLYGDVDTINSRLEYLINNRELIDFYFKTPNIWINQKNKEYKGRQKRNNISKENDVKRTLRSEAYMISYDEMKLNETFINSKGLSASLARKDNVKALKTPHYKIVNNYNIYKYYGILEDGESFPTSALTFSNALDSLDQFIELGLLHSEYADTYPNSNYINRYPSALGTFKDQIILLLYKLKQDLNYNEYYSNIFSNKFDGYIKNDVTKKYCGLKLDTEEDFERFKNENFANLETEIPNYNLCMDIIYSSDLEYMFDENILEDKYIESLESNNRIPNNKYIYKFKDTVISRYKVLRNYNILIKKGIEPKNALLFSILYNSYINQSTLDFIKETIGLEVNYGLS